MLGRVVRNENGFEADEGDWEMIDDDPRDYIEVGNFNSALGFIVGVELTLICGFVIEGVSLAGCVYSLYPGVFFGIVGYVFADSFVQLFG